jgi:hypothetical protein
VNTSFLRSVLSLGFCDFVIYLTALPVPQIILEGIADQLMNNKGY